MSTTSPSPPTANSTATSFADLIRPSWRTSPAAPPPAPAGAALAMAPSGPPGGAPPFETELAQALESHSFEPIKVLQWRNTALDFSSVGALQASLADTPKENGLTRAPIAEDILVL